MFGLEVDGRPLLRAYSFANAPWADELEFLSINVPDGPLTSRLQHIAPGDEVLVGTKPTGTLVLGALQPGRHLYLFGTGTGLAPFLSIIQDPDAYESYDKIVLVHGVRQVSDLAYRSFIERELPEHELLGALVANQLLYYPTVTREEFVHRGRITDLLESGELAAALGLPEPSPDVDRAMVCGSPEMIRDTNRLLEERGFVLGSSHDRGSYTYERAFVER